jgi:hypothetical protein
VEIDRKKEFIGVVRSYVRVPRVRCRGDNSAR